MKQFLVFLEENFLVLKKYKIRSFIWPFIIIPISFILDIILRQEYLNLVPFYNKFVPYLYILFVGLIIVDVIEWIIPWLSMDLEDPEFLKRFHFYNKIDYILGILIYTLFAFIIKVSIIFIPLHIIYKLPLKFYYFSLLGIILFIPFALAFGLFFGSLTLRYKSDAAPAWWAFNTFAWVIFPVSFSLMIFPEPVRTYLEIFIPPFAIIEEIRKLLILGNFNLKVLILSILVSLIYLILSIIIFVKNYEKGRKKGWLYLR